METPETTVPATETAPTAAKAPKAKKTKAEKQATLNPAAAAANTDAPVGATGELSVAEQAASEAGAPVATPAAKPTEPKEPGKIEQIIAFHKAGLSNQQIAEKGFNKTTISIQVSKYKKAQAAAKAVGTEGTGSIPAEDAAADVTAPEAPAAEAPATETEDTPI